MPADAPPESFEAYLIENPHLARGLFGQAFSDLVDDEQKEARAAYAAAWVRRMSAIAEDKASATQMREAVCACKQVGGVEITQLAELSDVARQTIYEWLRGCS